MPWAVEFLRTIATSQAKLCCPCVVRYRILNHVDSSVSTIYDRHHYDAEAPTWLQKWADYLEALTVSHLVPPRRLASQPADKFRGGLNRILPTHFKRVTISSYEYIGA